ncbi:uncharacterized protein TRAVEDRAFT_28943 [Trametes versicolor FP-101664 SS1]|uniref:uncharacterized protein n=1 Tax=Trametes versicolor (strain FP-101664) TaxID=717944 RepID=UPI0004623484|nr:uncharacterized protein TRAVEDRAFT_28943 [Trametes versicolor FP-101664 SS1]EIW58252.1 hypothetical protein TRAVEDRAFT_28943 [Trametes versicolor FP-101664 SS1]
MRLRLLGVRSPACQQFRSDSLLTNLRRRGDTLDLPGEGVADIAVAWAMGVRKRLTDYKRPSHLKPTPLRASSIVLSNSKK